MSHRLPVEQGWCTFSCWIKWITLIGKGFKISVDCWGFYTTQKCTLSMWTGCTLVMLKHLRLSLHREHFCSTTLELQATEKKSTENHPNKARDRQMCTKACWKLLKSWEWMKNLLFKAALCHYHSMHIIAKIMFSNRFLRYSHLICHWPVKQIVPPSNSLHWLSQKLTCRATQTNLFRSSGSQTTDDWLENLQWLKTHSIHFL